MEDEEIRERSFCSKLQKNLAAAQGTRKNEMDVLRTAFWFATLKDRLRVKTAYKVEKELNLRASSDDSERIPENKWPKYEVGLRLPQKSLVARVEARLPGTQVIFNHVLWQVLQTRLPVAEHADDWLHQLSPEVLRYVFKSKGFSYSRVLASTRVLRSLERNAGIDSLTYLTILLREMSEEGGNPLSIELGRSIYRMLLVLSVTECFGNFAEIFFDIYRQKIFPLATFKGKQLSFEHINFSATVSAFSTFIPVMPEANQPNFDTPARVRMLYDILNGRRGIEIKMILDPKIINTPSLD